MNKLRISRSFDKAKTDYDRHAVIQEGMAGRLLFDLDQLPTTRFDTVLEIGCGTGLLTRAMLAKFKIHRYIANDLVPGILTQTDAALEFFPGDIENAAIPAPIDLVISNAAFQWLENLPVLLNRLARVVRPGGWLAFSTFGPDNLKELAALTGAGLRYLSMSEVQQSLQAEFDILVAEETHVPLNFPDAMSVLRHLRATGVNSLSHRIWSKSKLQALLSEYEHRFSGSQGVPLTYHPMYFLAQRKKWPPVS